MRFLSSFYDVFHRPLARQVAALRCTLDHLCHRLRESIVRAIGTAVGDAVREAFRSVLGTPAGLTEEEEFPRRARPSSWSHASPYEHDLEPGTRWHDVDEPFFRGDDIEDEPDPVTPSPAHPWRTAWAIGLRVAAWTVVRCAAYPIPVAIGAGLITALAALTGSPAIAAGASMLGVLTCLPVLDDNGRAGIDRVGILTDR